MNYPQFNWDPNNCCGSTGTGTGTITVEGFNSICTKCMIDDVAGDGSNLIPYVEAFYQEVDENGALTVTALGIFTDSCLSTAYTVQGTATDPSTIGTDAVFKSQRREITGVSTWSPAATVHSFTVVVEALGAGVTFTDSDGVVTNLRQGRGETWAHDENLSDAAPIIAGTAGSIVTINYTEIG